MPTRRYTDQQFLDAVADPDVRTIADLCRRLGIVPRGGNYDTLRRLADRLAMTLPASTRSSPVAHQHRLGPTPSHTDDQLLAAIGAPQVDSYPALCRELGLRPHPTTHGRLRARAEALGSPLPASWSKPGPKQRVGAERRFTTESLSTALLLARTRKEVLEFLGVAATGASYRRLAQQLEEDDLDHSHLHPNATRAAPLEEVLVRGRGSRSSSLRRRLIRKGLLEARCSRCRRTEWEGEAVPLELDHIDGDRWNNDLRNLSNSRCALRQPASSACHDLTTGDMRRHASTPWEVVMIRLDADGNRYSDQYCLRCDMAPPHYALGWGGPENYFQCERCKSPIGDQDESGLGSTWLPDGRG